MSDNRIRVVIADDHRGVRYTLRVIMEDFDDIQIIGEATNGNEAISLCESLQPDLVLMDLVMPYMDGVMATRLIARQLPHIRILVLTSGTEPDLITAALRAGACGYLEKNVEIDRIASAIRSAIQP
jgi:two-component system, NarL family, response regulator LiaR